MAGRTITIQSGPRTGTKIDVDSEPSKAQAPGGTNTDTGQQETVDEAVDRMSGGGPPPKQNQSTDHMNNY